MVTALPSAVENNAISVIAFPLYLSLVTIKTAVLSLCLSLQLDTQANPYAEPVTLLARLALQSHWILLLWLWLLLLLLDVLVGRCGEHSSWNRENKSSGLCEISENTILEFCLIIFHMHLIVKGKISCPYNEAHHYNV